MRQGCILLDSSSEWDPLGFANRLKRALDTRTVYAVSRELGIAQSVIRKYLAGKTVPGIDKVLKLANLTGVNPEWLATGRDPRYSTESDSDDMVWVPRYDLEVAAGIALPQEDAAERRPLAFRRDWLQKRGLAAEHLTVISVGGDSMEPVLADGDLILVDLNEREPALGSPYVFRMGNNFQVKYWEVTPGGPRLVSENPRYPPYTLSLEELEQTEIIGRVVISIHKW